MQDLYYNSAHTSSKSDSKTPILLRPEQISVPQGRQSHKASFNSIIRLSESIKKYGILEPLTVKATFSAAGEPIYELISGERRLKAAISAGITRIPCVLASEDSRSGAISGVLSGFQQGLHIFEQAAALRLLIEDFGLTQEEIARKIGISQSAVANKLRLLQLPKEEQRQILAAKLTERHARALLRLKEQGIREEALRRVIAERMTVAATEQLIEDLKSVAPNSAEQPAVSVILTPETPPKGVLPRKFALRDLTPLYNSIERILSIFRKTGATALSRREESPNGVRIIIDIPKA